MFIRGFDPVIDNKIDTAKHPLWKELCREKKKYRYDARLDRVKPDQMLINAMDIQHLVTLDDINEKDYKYEKMVAEKTRSEMPGEFRRSIIQIDVADLMALDPDKMDYEDMLHPEMNCLALAASDFAGNLITEKTRVTYGYENSPENLEEIKRNRLAAEKREEQLKEKIELEEKEKIRIDELNRDETMAVLALKQRGFTEKQIKIILVLVNSNKNWDMLLDFFEPEFTEEELEAYVKKLSM